MSAGGARRRRHRLREGLLSAGALLGVLSILLAVAAAVLGVTPLVFRSGSMSPAVETGDLGIARTVPAADLREGDIVSVLTSRGVRVTHRIVSIDRPEGADGPAELVLRGDANEASDPERYPVTETDRLLFSVPRAGYVAGWLSGPGGVFLAGLLVGVVLLVLLARPRGPRDRTPGRRRADPADAAGTGSPVRSSRVVLGLLLVVLTATAVTPTAVDTLAAWDDAVDVDGVSATGYTVPKPAIASCVNTPSGSTSARHVTLTWPGVTSPGTTYTAAVSTLTGATTTFAGTTTKTVDVLYNATTTANQNKRVTVTVTPALSGSPTWTGPADTWQFQTGGFGAQPTCGEETVPTLVISDPDTTTRTASAMVTYMNGFNGCNSTTRPACGTMSDASAITSVQYVLQRVRSGVTSCWTGSAYGTDCTTWRTATMGSTTSWYAGGSNSTVYASPGGVFTLTVRVTDTWGNVTTQTRSFTVTA